MRNYVIVFLLLVVCLASASIKDPRKNVKLSPELSQDTVAAQQAGQHGIGQVGGVPEQTDGSGYIPRSEANPDAAAMIVSHGAEAEERQAEEQVLRNQELAKEEAQKPKKAAFNLIWALLAGLTLAFGVWIGLSKYGPQPPERFQK